MKPFRRAIIHIGTERTGSTSVQKAMFAHRQALGDAGVFVPLSLLRSYETEAGIANHVLFVLALADHERFPSDLVPIELAALGLAPDALQRHVTDTMLAELARNASAAHTVLISAEHIHSRLDSPGEVSRIREVLEPMVEEFQIVVLLRPQVEMAASLANLAIRKAFKKWRLIPTFDDDGGYDRAMGVRRSYFELDDMLRRLEAVFGKAAIHPCRYESQGAFDSRAVVFGAVGVARPEPGTDDRENASLSSAALQVMRSIHQNIDLIENPEWRPGFIDYVDRMLVREHRGPGLRPGREASRRFMEQFAAGNERIRKRYFPQSASLFEVDFDSYPERSETLGDVPDWARAYVDVLVKTWLR